MDIQTEEFWINEFPDTVEALAQLPKRDTTYSVPQSLAFIAGDYADMSEDQIIATYINENI